LVDAGTAGTAVRVAAVVAALVCDVLRDLFGMGVAFARVLPSQAGLSLVTVTFIEWPSSDCGGRRPTGVA